MITASYCQQILDGVTSRLRGRLPREEHTVPWVLLAGQLLQAEGHDAILCAGSAFWPTGTNWFGYRWNPQSRWNTVWQSIGLPPEFHAWIEIRQNTPLVLDVTTGSWPHRAEQRGIIWTGEKPPDVFCSTAVTARNYTAYRDATIAAMKLAKRLGKLYPKLLGDAVAEQFARHV